MAIWRVLVSNPLVMVEAVLFIVFVTLAILHLRDRRRWILPVAIVLAAASLTGAIGFASLRSRSVRKPKASSAKPASMRAENPAHSAAAGQGRRIWVFQDPAQILEYDWSTSSPRQSIGLPRDLVQLASTGAAGKLKINLSGQMLLGPVFSSSGSPAKCEVWVWNGQAEARLQCGSDSAKSQQAESDQSLEVTLSQDGQHLFWSANQGQSSGQDENLGIITTFHIWQTDLAGGQRQDLDSFTFPACKCSTGACEETCPQGSLWAPETGIDSFFLVTHFVPGQLQSETLASFAYRGLDGRWSSKKLPAPLEGVADATRNGSVLIELVPDSACCGWENESNDQTLLLSGGRSTVLFDEQARFGNPNYDVNFSTPQARLSPDLTLVAMTIVATAHPGDEIRLAAGGKNDAAELERIRQALVDLPAVEVVSAGVSAQRIAFLPHATLVGWLNNKELLIIEDHVLAAYDIAAQVHRKSTIAVADAAHVFLR